MRHRVKSTRLDRHSAHLRAMLSNLVTSVILYEKVSTTHTKAKLAQPLVEKAITIGKKKAPLIATRELNQLLANPLATQKLLKELKGRYQDRSSGFTRVVRQGFRVGDAARLARLELI